MKQVLDKRSILKKGDLYFMRKILLLLTSIMMALGIVACGGNNGGSEEQEKDGNTPEATVAALLDAIKEGDQSKVNEYVSKEDKMYSEDTETDITQAKVMFENMTYNIQSVNTDTESAPVVTVEVTNVDMNVIMQAYMQKALEAAGENPDMTEEEAIALLQDTITENKDKTITKTVDLEVTQGDNGEWKVKTTSELNTIIAGGLSEDTFQ